VTALCKLIMHLRRPLSCLTPHISRTHANICITLISLETTFTRLHFRRWQYGSICIQIFVVGSKRQACSVIVHNGRSRSSKVIDIYTNRKLSINFLLVINSNFGRILHRFRDIAAQRSKNRFFAPPTLLEAPAWGTPSEFLDETYPTETRGMGENCIILTSNAFDW